MLNDNSIISISNKRILISVISITTPIITLSMPAYLPDLITSLIIRLAAVSVETERLRVDVTAAQSKVNVGVATLTSCREELVEARDHLTASKETNQTNAKLASDKISTLKLKYGAKLKQKQATYDEEVEKV